MEMRIGAGNSTKIIFAAMVGVLGCSSLFASSEVIDLKQLHVDDKIVAGGTLEPARLMRAEGWEFEHEVRVFLPPRYKTTDKRYPTLWVTDNALEIAIAASVASATGYAPEVILVSIGAPMGIPHTEWNRRREYDFDREVADPNEPKGADRLLDFLVNTVRPALAAEYRMDPDEHALAGHSGGGMFCLHVLFTRPESFSKYLIGSPATGPWLEMEQAYHENHDDLAARVFLAAGEAEMTDFLMAFAQVVSTVAEVAERLTLREYPSLEIEARIIPGAGHGEVMPILYARGIRSLWKERIPTVDHEALSKWIQEYLQQQAE